jgi:hypothetical protein
MDFWRLTPDRLMNASPDPFGIDPVEGRRRLPENQVDMSTLTISLQAPVFR